jgi:hypothetical protein
METNSSLESEGRVIRKGKEVHLPARYVPPEVCSHNFLFTMCATIVLTQAKLQLPRKGVQKGLFSRFV